MSISLKNVGSGFKRSALNENFVSLEDEINNNLLNKDGSQQLEADLDMNSNKLINLAEGSVNSDAVNVGQLNAAVTGIGSGTVSKTTEVQLGSSAVARVFTISATATVGSLEVVRNGVEQEITEDYTLTPPSTVTLTYDPNDSDRFKFKVYTAS